MPGNVPQSLPEGEREGLLERLKDAFAAGHLSHDEMDQHLHTVLAARSSIDLVPVEAALPVTEAPRTVSLGGTSGRIRRTGAWQVPAVLEIESEYALVDLDLTEAVFEAASVTIDLQLRFGSARITVPPDAVVDIDGLRAVWKQPAYRAPERTPVGGPQVRVTGAMEFGQLRVRHRAR